MQQQSDDRSIGELFAELARETSTLVRQEVNLARTELTQKATSAGKDVGMAAAGGVLAFAGFLVLLAALVIILDLFLPLWLSALIVGVVVVGIGAVLALRGINALRNLDPAPRETIETLKEDAEWAKEQTR